MRKNGYLYAVSFETSDLFNQYRLPDLQAINYDDFTVHIVVSERDPDNSMYDESSDVRVVLKAEFSDGAVRHFLKAGRQDSYGDYRWDAKLVEVKPVEKVVYEYSEI